VRNGTDALQVAMMALGLKPGDEVITASFTFVATVEVLACWAWCPFLPMCILARFNLDPADVARKVTPKTKAIVPVHLFGQNADMDALLAIAREYGLPVVEDATARAIGSVHSGVNGKRKSGTMGDIGVTSFFPSKNLGCYGDGGALFTNDDELAQEGAPRVQPRQRCALLPRGGGREQPLGFHAGRHPADQTAALGRLCRGTQCRAAAAYDKAFVNIPGLTVPERSTYSDHVFHQYTLRGGGRSSRWPEAASGGERRSGHGILPGALPRAERIQKQALSGRLLAGNGTALARSVEPAHEHRAGRGATGAHHRDSAGLLPMTGKGTRTERAMGNERPTTGN
jgi:hypothetical protein